MRYPQTLIFAAILLLSKCMLGQDIAVTVMQPPTANRPLAAGSIIGKVMCADTRKPARGARIMVMAASTFGEGEQNGINSGPPPMASTALDGSFRVPQRGAILAGTVVYSDGSPAAELPVLLQKPEPAKGEGKQEELIDAGAMLGEMLGRQRSITDDQGHFRISGIPAGRYRLTVIQKFEQNTNLDDLVDRFNPGLEKNDRLTIYSGNTLHQKDAKFYELRPGETLDGVEIILPLTGLHSIQGVATAKDGTPLNFGLLSLSDTADPTINFHTKVRAGGEFRFTGISEGIYEMKITRGGVFENPPQFDFSDELSDGMEDQFKPIRAFAETKVVVTVQTTDVDDLVVTLADTKLPDKAAPAADSEKTVDGVVVRPQ